MGVVQRLASCAVSSIGGSGRHIDQGDRRARVLAAHPAASIGETHQDRLAHAHVSAQAAAPRHGRVGWVVTSVSSCESCDRCRHRTVICCWPPEPLPECPLAVGNAMPDLFAGPPSCSGSRDPETGELRSLPFCLYLSPSAPSLPMTDRSLRRSAEGSRIAPVSHESRASRTEPANHACATSSISMYKY